MGRPVASTRAEACRPGPGLRPPPVPGLRARGDRLPDPRGAGRVRAEHLRPAGAAGLDPRPGLRRRVLLHAHLLDVGRPSACPRGSALAGWRRSSTACSGAAAGPLQPAALVARVAGRRLGDDGALAHRVAVQRDAVGPARVRRRRHPGGRRAGLRRHERPVLPARAERLPPGLGGARAGTASRLVAAGVLAGGPRAVMVVPSLAPYDARRATAPPTVAVVQGNVPPPENDILADHRAGDRQPRRRPRSTSPPRWPPGSVPQPDFVLWPENSTAVDPFRDAATNAGDPRAPSPRSASRSWSAPSSTPGEDHVLNQGIVWDPETGAGERYTKHHPVPYGEYIPFRSCCAAGASRTTGSSAGSRATCSAAPATSRCGSPGSRSPTRSASTSPTTTCIYDQVETAPSCSPCRPATRASSSPTRSTSSSRSPGCGRSRPASYLVVASTNGITGVIAPDGSVVAAADPRTQAVLRRAGRAAARRHARRCGWARGSAVLLPLLTAVGLALRLVTYRRERRPRPPRRRPNLS